MSDLYFTARNVASKCQKVCSSCSSIIRHKNIKLLNNGRKCASLCIPLSIVWLSLLYLSPLCYHQGKSKTIKLTRHLERQIGMEARSPIVNLRRKKLYFHAIHNKISSYKKISYILTFLLIIFGYVTKSVNVKVLCSHTIKECSLEYIF